MPKKQKNHVKLTPPDDGRCLFCFSKEDKEDKYGKFLSKEDVNVHYYCLLFASGLGQYGKEDDDLFGFRFKEIHAEFRRGSKLRCTYCKELGATIGCCKGSCRVQFHYGCGFDNNALCHFYDNFSSLCVDHRPVQEVQLHSSSRKCSICLSPVLSKDVYNEIRAACCANGMFHRQCIQRQAIVSGVHFFKCALCNNKETFQREMLYVGIYIPDKDAEWELEPNAYADLLERHNRCDVQPCKCPQGRETNELSSEFELMLCDCCGSSGTHLACSNLKTGMDDWECAQCATITAKNAAATPKRVPKSPAASVSVATVLSPGSPVPVVKAKKMTAQELQAKQHMLKYNGSLSSPTSLPNRRKLVPSLAAVQSLPDNSSSSNPSRNKKRRRPRSSSGHKSITQQDVVNESSRKRKKRRKAESEQEGGNYKPSQEQIRKSQLSMKALSVVTGLHVPPKPRQTQRSRQAEDALAEIKAAAVDLDKVKTMQNSMRSILGADIFTGRNVGARLAEAYAVPEGKEKAVTSTAVIRKVEATEKEVMDIDEGNEEGNDSQQEQQRLTRKRHKHKKHKKHRKHRKENRESPGTARCRPLHHKRLHRLYRGGQGGERARWRYDTSPRSVRTMLASHRSGRKRARDSTIEDGRDIATRASAVCNNSETVSNDVTNLEESSVGKPEISENSASVKSPPMNCSRSPRHGPNMRSPVLRSHHRMSRNDNSPVGITKRANTRARRTIVYSPSLGKFKVRSPLSVKQGAANQRQGSSSDGGKELEFLSSSSDSLLKHSGRGGAGNIHGDGEVDPRTVPLRPPSPSLIRRNPILRLLLSTPRTSSVDETATTDPPLLSPCHSLYHQSFMSSPQYTMNNDDDPDDDDDINTPPTLSPCRPQSSASHKSSQENNIYFF